MTVAVLEVDDDPGTEVSDELLELDEGTKHGNTVANEFILQGEYKKKLYSDAGFKEYIY